MPPEQTAEFEIRVAFGVSNRYELLGIALSPPDPRTVKKRVSCPRFYGRYRRLSKDYEELPQSSENMIYIAMTNLMLHRLEPERKAA